MRLLRMILIAGLMLLLWFLLIAARPLAEPDWTSLVDVLTWLAYSGGSIGLVMWFASWFLEGFPSWHGLPAQTKQLIIIVLSIAVGTGAHLLLGYEQLLATVAPWFKLMTQIIIAYLGSQVAYARTPEVISRRE